MNSENPPLVSAPPSYRGMSRAMLDAAYDNVAHVGPATREAYVADWWTRANAVRARPGARLDLRYGEGPRQRVDIFPCGKANAPTVAYIHGGYWQWNDKERDAFIAEGLGAAGFNLALLEYTLAPVARMADIVGDVRAGVGWVVQHSGDWQGDAERVFVAGHSAGGHLAAMALGVPRIAGGVAISGIFDLEPIRLGRLNDNLGLDAATSDQHSPLRHLPAQSPPLVVAVGLGELPELIRQSEEFATARRERGLPGAYLPVPKRDHFSILEELARPEGLILRALKDLAGGGGRN